MMLCAGEEEGEANRVREESSSLMDKKQSVCFANSLHPILYTYVTLIRQPQSLVAGLQERHVPRHRGILR